MAKRALKAALGATGDYSLVDTDRITPKADGGIYEPANVRLLDPRAHMERHGTLRDRTTELAELKAVFDDRAQTMKLLLKVQNQQRAYLRRTDDQYLPTVNFVQETETLIEERLKIVDKDIRTHVKQYAEVDPLTKVVLSVRGVGPITAAALAVYVDLNKAQSASALWAYAGYDKPSHERYAKGKAGGGNKTLRTVLYNTVVSMMKDKESPYRLVYDREKQKLEVSEKHTKSRNTQGHLIECAWKDTKPSHRHGAALRKMAKHFLADYWFVGREMLGLSTRPLYVEEQLGHTGIIRPRERGWEW